MTAPFAVATKQGDVWTPEDILRDCPLCGAHAIVELTPRLKKLQPDGTTLVCHPGFGGCNTGFELDFSIITNTEKK